MSGMWDHEEAGVFVEALFAKHHDEIYAYLLRMLREPELAADLTQDAFIKAYKNYETLEKPENARAWLYQIAHRVALDEIRRRKIIRFFPWTGESRGSAPSAEHLVMDVHLSSDMQRALARDPGTPAGRPPARRAPRPDRRRAGRGARGQPRRRPRTPDPGPREPAPGARRRARGRGREPRPSAPVRTRPSAADEPDASPPPAPRQRIRRDHARARELAADRLGSPLERVDATLARRASRRVRGVPLDRGGLRGRPARAARPARPPARGRRATCGPAPRPRSNANRPPPGGRRAGDRSIVALRTAARGRFGRRGHRPRHRRRAPCRARSSASRPTADRPGGEHAAGRDRLAGRSRPDADRRRCRIGRLGRHLGRRRPRLQRDPGRARSARPIASPTARRSSDNQSKAVHMDVQPKSISQSPVRNQAVVVGTDAHGRRRGRRDRAADRRADRDAGRRPSTPTVAPTDDARAHVRRRPADDLGAVLTSAIAPTADTDAQPVARADARRRPRRRQPEPSTPEPTVARDPRHRVGRQGRRPVGGLLARRRLVRLHGPPVGRLGRPRHLRLAGRRRRSPDRSRPIIAASSRRGSAAGSSAAVRPPSGGADVEAALVLPRSGDRPGDGPQRAGLATDRRPGWRPGGDLGRHRHARQRWPDLGPGRPGRSSCAASARTSAGPRRRRGHGRGRRRRLGVRRPLGRDRHAGSRSGSPTRPIRRSAG